MRAKTSKRTGRPANATPSASPGDALQVNVAAASQQELTEWVVLLKRRAREVNSVKLLCHRNPMDALGGRGNSRGGGIHSTSGQFLVLTSKQHRAAVAESSAKLLSDKLRGCLPDALCKVVSASSLRHLQLSPKMPLKVYEQLATALTDNHSIEVLSLAGSCCGDTALAALLSAVTRHSQLQVLELSGCCLSDSSAERLAVLLKAQGAAAAQHAWVEGLRGGAFRSCSSRAQYAATAAGLPADKAQGLRVLDLSQNQIGVVGLQAIAAALANEHSSLLHLNLSGNQLPGAEAAAHCILQALQHDAPSRNFTVDLTANSWPSGLTTANEPAPTISALGVWAGVLQCGRHSAAPPAAAHNNGMAAAAAAVRACRPQRQEQGLQAVANKSEAHSSHEPAPTDHNKLAPNMPCGVVAAHAVQKVQATSAQTGQAEQPPNPVQLHVQATEAPLAQISAGVKTVTQAAGQLAGLQPQQQQQQRCVLQPQAGSSSSSSQESQPNSNQTQSWVCPSSPCPVAAGVIKQPIPPMHHTTNNVKRNSEHAGKQRLLQHQNKQCSNIHSNTGQWSDCHTVSPAQESLLEAVRQQQQALQWLLSQQQEPQKRSEHAKDEHEEALAKLVTMMCDLSEKVSLLEQLYSSNSNTTSGSNPTLSQEPAVNPASATASAMAPLDPQCWPTDTLPTVQQQQQCHKQQHQLRLNQHRHASAVSKNLSEHPIVDAARLPDGRPFCAQAYCPAMLRSGSSLSANSNEQEDDISSYYGFSSSSSSSSSAITPVNSTHTMELSAWCKTNSARDSSVVDSISRQLLHLHGLS